MTTIARSGRNPLRALLLLAFAASCEGILGIHDTDAKRPGVGGSAPGDAGTQSVAGADAGSGSDVGGSAGIGGSPSAGGNGGGARGGSAGSRSSGGSQSSGGTRSSGGSPNSGGSPSSGGADGGAGTSSTGGEPAGSGGEAGCVLRPNGRAAPPSHWASWPMPNPPGAPAAPSLSASTQTLPHPQSYDTSCASGIVVDNVTDLEWQRDIDLTPRTWADANAYCEGLDDAGYDDWRMPTRIELISIIDFTPHLGSDAPTLDGDAFPDWTQNLGEPPRDKHWMFWTATERTPGGQDYGVIFFNSGMISYGAGSNPFNMGMVRCVR